MCVTVSSSYIIKTDIIPSQQAESSCAACFSSVLQGGDTALSLQSDGTCAAVTSIRQGDNPCSSGLMPNHNNYDPTAANQTIMSFSDVAVADHNDGQASLTDAVTSCARSDDSSGGVNEIDQAEKKGAAFSCLDQMENGCNLKYHTAMRCSPAVSFPDSIKGGCPVTPQAESCCSGVFSLDGVNAETPPTTEGADCSVSAAFYPDLNHGGGLHPSDQAGKYLPKNDKR